MINMHDFEVGDPNTTFWIVFSSMMLLMSWMKGKLRLEDKEVLEAHEFVMRSLEDADFCTRIEMATGKNLRDQMSVEEIIEMEREVKLLKMGNERN